MQPLNFKWNGKILKLLIPRLWDIEKSDLLEYQGMWEGPMIWKRCWYVYRQRRQPSRSKSIPVRRALSWACRERKMWSGRTSRQSNQPEIDSMNARWSWWWLPSTHLWSSWSWPAGSRWRSSTPRSRSQCWTWRCKPGGKWHHCCVKSSDYHGCDYGEKTKAIATALCQVVLRTIGHLNMTMTVNIGRMIKMTMTVMMIDDLTFNPSLPLQSVELWTSSLQLFSQSSIWWWWWWWPWRWPQWWQ